jgi:hypothetical protein
MTVEHIPRILDGKMPSASLLHAIAEDGIAISEILKYDMTRFTTFFSYTSEMEATVRVISLICEVAQDLTNDNIRIKLQPSLRGHATFTDLLICVESSGSLLLITEVVKPAMSAMFGENDPTAQILREAHIVLHDKNFNVQKLWFILTNASLWSIGMAENAGDKIKVTECYQHFILYKKGSDLDEQDTKILVTLLYELKQILSQAV